MRLAVPVGIAAAAVQVIGLLRWPLLVPGYAADATSPDPAVAAAARDSFHTAHRVLGTIVGETFGYLLTAAWTLLVLAALGRAIAGRWFTVLGAGSAVLILAGVLSPLDLPLIDTANFAGYILWSVWLVAFAVLLVRRPPRRRPHPHRAGADRRQELIPMSISPPTRSTFLRPWLIWTAGFLFFPIAGLAGTAVAGRVDSPAAALAAGLVTGAVLGAGQSLASSRRLDPRRWIVATSVGMGVGLLLGAAAVGFATSLADLAVMGALTGLVLGAAQALALPVRARYRGAWAAAFPALWALGWTITTLGGIDVDRQFSVFGAYGAITFSALSGVLLHGLLPVRATGAPTRPLQDERRTRHRADHGAAPARAIRATARPSPRLIFGTGAIGLATLDALRRRGEAVRLVNRSGTAPVPDDVEVVEGDAARPGLHRRRRGGSPGRLPDPQPALPPVGGAVPRPAGRCARRRPSHRRAAGQHGERLHVRAAGRTAPHRDPPVRGPHQERAASRPDGAVS